MWTEVAYTIVGTGTFFISSYQLGKFCARKELSNSLKDLEKASKKLNKEKDTIDACINEHHKLLLELEQMWKWN